MTISFDQRVTARQDTLVNVVDEEAVILNLKSECYFGLDKVGTSMWNALTTSESIQAAYESLLNRYDVDGATLRDDLVGFVEKLVEKDLVVVSGE